MPATISSAVELTLTHALFRSSARGSFSNTPTYPTCLLTLGHLSYSFIHVLPRFVSRCSVPYHRCLGVRAEGGGGESRFDSLAPRHLDALRLHQVQ